MERSWVEKGKLRVVSKNSNKSNKNTRNSLHFKIKTILIIKTIRIRWNKLVFLEETNKKIKKTLILTYHQLKILIKPSDSKNLLKKTKLDKKSKKWISNLSKTIQILYRFKTNKWGIIHKLLHRSTSLDCLSYQSRSICKLFINQVFTISLLIHIHLKTNKR